MRVSGRLATNPEPAACRGARRHVGRTSAASFLVLGGLGLQSTGVRPPDGWHVGDAHEFFPACDVALFDPGARALEIRERMLREGLEVVAAQLWVGGPPSCAEYRALQPSLVTGREHPLTLGDPAHFLQIGVELAVVEPEPCQVDQWGHVLGLNVSDGGWDPEVDYPAPSLDFLRAQPGALAGYAHVFWPVELEPPPINLDDTRFYPLLAPFDAVLGRLQLLEANDVDGSDGITAHPWYGLYYRLNDLGLTAALAAGSAGRCYREMRGDSRTWVAVEGELDYASWVDGITAHRTTIADGPDDFLSLTVDGAPQGSVLELETTGGSVELEVEVDYRASEGLARSTTIEIVRDGEVVAAEAVELPSGGRHLLRVRVPVRESGWIAARLAGPMRAHTSAVPFFLDGRPAGDLATAEHFAAYADFLREQLERLTQLCARCPDPDCEACDSLRDRLGDSGAEILDYLVRGRRAYRILAELERPLPAGVRRTSRARAALPPPATVLSGPPSPGAPLEVACAFPPRAALTWLVVEAGARGRLPLLPGATHLAALAPGWSEGRVAAASLGPLPGGLPLGLRWYFAGGPDVRGALAASDELRMRAP